MNPEIKQRWLEALRGGRYTQGRGQLRNENQCFCCLGVLCDISGLGRWDPDNSYVMPGDPAGSSGLSYPPLSLQAEIGLPIQARNVLAAMNDSQARSFAAIADWIEEAL